MNINKIRKYLLSKAATTEKLPFGPQALVFKVLGKIYEFVISNRGLSRFFCFDAIRFAFINILTNP